MIRALLFEDSPCCGGPHQRRFRDEGTEGSGLQTIAHDCGGCYPTLSVQSGRFYAEVAAGGGRKKAGTSPVNARRLSKGRSTLSVERLKMVLPFGNVLCVQTSTQRSAGPLGAGVAAAADRPLRQRERGEEIVAVRGRPDSRRGFVRPGTNSKQRPRVNPLTPSPRPG